MTLINRHVKLTTEIYVFVFLYNKMFDCFNVKLQWPIWVIIAFVVLQICVK